MYPPIYAVCANHAPLTALIGTNPVRLFPGGEGPQDQARPYVVWSIIAGVPENYLADLPDVDSWSIQLDAYATTLTAVRDVAEALRNAVEAVGYVARFYGELRDPDTNLYRYSMDADFWTPRDYSSS